MKTTRISAPRAVEVAAALIAASAVAAAQIAFDAPVTYTAGTQPHCVALADFDGDGDVDIAATVHDPARLSLLRNNGLGVFAAPTFTPLVSGTNPVGILADDFNADGHVDVMLSYSATNSVKYMRNLGDGDFVGGDFAIVGTEPTFMAKGDFDADGDMDVAVSNRTSNSVSFVRNLGDGHFALMSGVDVGVSPRMLAVGKLDGDAWPDVAVAAHDSHRIDILKNLANGHFQKVLSLPLGFSEKPEGIAIADIDGDGDQDILTTASDTSVHDVVVFRQLTPGVFCDCDYFDTGGVLPQGILIADFDFDTLPDVAVVNATSSTVSVLRNTTDPLLTLDFVDAVPGPAPDTVMVADLDGNHYLDLVVTNDGDDSVSVLLNGNENPMSYCTGGLNSLGYTAQIDSSGSLSVETNEFTLHVIDAVPQVNGMFIYGLAPQEKPFYGGYLCIRSPIVRLTPPLVTDVNGAASHWVDFNAPPSRYAQIRPGSIWNFQFWYRDPSAGGGSTSNLTNAWRVVFEP